MQTGLAINGPEPTWETTEAVVKGARAREELPQLWRVQPNEHMLDKPTVDWPSPSLTNYLDSVGRHKGWL